MTTSVSNRHLHAEAQAELDELAALPWMLRLTAICLLATGLGWVAGSFASVPTWIPWVLYVLAFASGGWFPLGNAWESLRQREFDVNFLMIVAAIGAAAVGQPREGAILMFLFALSNTLETYAMGRTHRAVNALLEMAPDQATRIAADGTQAVVAVADLTLGDRVLVRPGERIPVDGIVRIGASSINEAAITGESLPVDKAAGSKVFAGTLNTTGALTIEVTVAVGDTTLARIIETVAEARSQKAKAQDFTDRVIGQYYAYAVVAMTLLAIAIPLLFLDWDLKTTLYRAMALMVVASPCALVISIPAAMLSAMANAARHGMLFKGGRYLEAAAKIKVVALDKTGTLTTGQLSVTQTLDLGQYPTEHWLKAAAAVEAFSEHPLAKAIVNYAEQHNISVPTAVDFQSITGMGAQADVHGQLVQVGRPRLWGELVQAQAANLEAEGATVIGVGTTEQVWGLIALADTVRPESKQAIAALHAAGVKRVVLLTGDNRAVAQHVASQLGIDDVRAELLPGDKARMIEELQQTYGPVAMVGDGVNDAPALAKAELGVAMGVAGTDVALQSADVLLLSDDLLKLAEALRLGRRAQRIVWQNIAFAGGVIAVLLVSALFGNIALPLGVIGHEGSTLLVVANGLRLLRR
ncbi:heavy metal translocating P-type ATPase [Herpetosiphon llansteffanensis]|uniref:heavy metal translocating P-type ATPase n=1 Tax=Herpetosiphon llansteffanensis TaxID=2094568 RepID=UPI000D7D0BFC|nr:heavy metal translocating P-type ATPase [Herpetosiphon llansteffanensis]